MVFFHLPARSDIYITKKIHCMHVWIPSPVRVKVYCFQFMELTLFVRSYSFCLKCEREDLFKINRLGIQYGFRYVTPSKYYTGHKQNLIDVPSILRRRRRPMHSLHESGKIQINLGGFEPLIGYLN